MYYSKSLIEINLNSLADNYKYLKSYVSRGCTIGAVIKANSYGIGAEEISKQLEKEGCTDFFVHNLDEALKLSHLKKAQNNIHILSGFHQNEYKEIVQNGFIPMIYNFDQLEAIEGSAEKPNFCIKFDTGIKRLGFTIADLGKLKAKLSNQELSKNLLYITSHLGSAEEMQNDRNLSQYNKFQAIKEHFPNNKFSLAHSAGIFLGHKYQEDLVRPGAYLYGICGSQSKDNKQKVVVSRYAEIMHRYIADEDSYIGYGSTYKLYKGQKVLIARIGYADGYSRTCSNKGHMICCGKKLPVIGSVTMDMTSLDASSLTDQEFATCSFAEVFGKNLNIEEAAKAAGTIPYELLAKMGTRFDRKYVS